MNGTGYNSNLRWEDSNFGWNILFRNGNRGSDSDEGSCAFKGGYLDFSHLTKLRNIYKCITEIYMKKQYKSSITKNHKIRIRYFLMVFP